MKGKKIIIGVLCGIGAIAIGFGAWNYKALANGARKLTSSPEEYFRYIEQKSAETKSSVLGNWYEIAKEAFDFTENKTYEGSVSVELGEELHDLVQDGAGEDISAMKKVGMTVSAIVGEGVEQSAFNGTLLLNDTEVVSGTYWFDLAETLGFLQIPKLSKDIIYSSAADMDEDTEYVISAGDALKILNQISEKLPEKERIETLINRYAEVALSCFDDVDETSETLRAEGLSMRCTKLTTVLSGKELSEIAETVLDTMMEDEDLEALIKEVASAQDFVDADEIYDEFYESLEELYETVDEIEEFEEDIVYSVWVDEKGTIAGRMFEIGDEAEMSYAIAREKNTIGVELEADIEGEKFSVKGTGTLEGMTVTGDFTVKIAGERVLAVQIMDVDLTALMSGRRKGTVTLLPIGAFKDELKDLEEELDYYDISLKLRDLAAVFSFDANENTSTSSFAIELDEELFLKVSYENGQKDGGELNFPNRADALELKESAEFLEWFSGADLESVYDTLLEEGIPEGWLTELDISMDSLKYEAAVLYVEQGDYQKAKDLFVALGEHIDAEEFAYYCEGMLLYEKGNLEEAMELFEEIDGYHWEMSSGIVACKYALAEKYLAEENYEEAAEFYKAVMADYYAYDEYEDADTKHTYAEAMQMLQEGDYTTAQGWLSEIADSYPPAQKALEECIRLKEEELAYLQRPEHWLYPTDYASYADSVVIPERYLGIPMEKVTEAEFEDYLLTNLEGAMSYGGEISDEEKTKLYKKCEEEKYTFALMDYLLEHAEVPMLDEASLGEKSKIDMYRYRLEMESMGIEWELIVSAYGSEEELQALFEEERRAREEALLVAYAIAKKEGLTVTEADFDNYVKDMSEEFGITKEDFLQANPQEVLEDAFLIEKCLLFLIENAEIR